MMVAYHDLEEFSLAFPSTPAYVGWVFGMLWTGKILLRPSVNGA